MIKVPERAIQETKAIVRICFFLGYEVGLKYADKLSAKELKQILYVLKTKKKA